MRSFVDAVCYVTDDIRKAFGRQHAQLAARTIHNGIDPLDRSAYPRPPELTAPGFHVGIVGRVTPVKGIPTAISALANSDAPPAAQLHVVGTGPEEARLRRQAAAAGVAGRVHFHGFRQDIFAWLAHLDALLMPSLHEGLPYTLLEAMSLSRPIVASRVGGLAEVIEDGRTGILVEVGSPEQVSAALRRLADDAELRGRLGAAARQAQAQRLTLDGMGRSYLEVYAQAGTAARRTLTSR
jgi:glycosyltransferase involved in cell wall biosynthesis